MASALVMTAITLTGIDTMTAYAVEGWSREGEEWRYLDQKDQPVQNAWKQSKGAWFYLGTDGVMLRECFVERGNGLYYVDETGKRIEDAWYYIETEDGSGHDTGWYYFGIGGKAFRGTNSPAMKTVDGKAYMFSTGGCMLTGWMNEEGEPLDEGDNPLEEGVYYAGEDGALKTESWLNYTDMVFNGLEDLYSDISGRNYEEYDQAWLYFDSHSKKVRSSGEKLKQMNIGGGTYGFDEYGLMLPWWTKVASISNADKSNPTSDVSAKFFAGYDGGSLLRDTWFWMYPSDNLLEEDFAEEEYSWWRTDQNGEVYRNRIKKVNNRYYGFDGLGRMQTGFALFDTRSTFVAQYDPDAWSSDDFKEGNLYGIEKADLYFFAPDELNDGSMQTGQVMVELEDGAYTFGFDSKGIAYGSRNTLRRAKNSFYINGLRLEADKEYGYGVVQEEDGTCRVVDTKGKIVTGNKTVVKDKDGGWLIIINGHFAARTEAEYKPRWHDGEDGPGFYYYDPKNKEDKFADGIIDGTDTEPSLDELPDEEKLNF